MTRRPVDTGSAGAFLAAAELALRGWPASLTYGNTARTDVLAQVGSALLPAAIQVKTKGETSRVFQLRGVHDPSAPDANEWVVLVALNRPSPADYFVVPRNHVCGAVVAVMEAKPRNQRGGLGPQVFERYRNEWELMEMPARDVDWRVEDWVYPILERLDWPRRPDPSPPS